MKTSTVYKRYKSFPYRYYAYIEINGTVIAGKAFFTKFMANRYAKAGAGV